MKRPYIICHMVTSIDGKVTVDFLARPECEKATDIYYELNRTYGADAFACGRVTMEESFTGGAVPALTPYSGAQIPREDFVGDPDAHFFAASFDRRGRLGWMSSRIVDEDPGYGGAHIIEVLCEDAPDAYLASLRAIGISYIFAGAHDLDLSLALSKLTDLFGIKTLLLEGGSILNGAFLQEDLVDELSLVVAPTIAEREDKPLFTDSRISDFTLKECTTYPDGVIWLNYKK